MRREQGVLDVLVGYEKILLRLYYDVDLFDPPGYEQTEPTCMVDVWYLWPCTP